MTQTATASVITPLRPVSKDGLEALAAKAKSNPNVIGTLKVKTVCEGQFRNLTYVRNLP
ncbi:MAG: OsmC family peroxiredoxin, partial [Pseudanabaena sp.]